MTRNNGTIEEMRNWVDYCNGKSGKFAEMRRENGYAESRNVPIWSVGNENYGRYEIGYKPIEQWAPLVADAAKAMKQDESGRQWTIALVNRHPQKPVACTLKMQEVLLDGEYAAMVLSGDSPDAFNDIENPDRVAPRKTTLTFTKG